MNPAQFPHAPDAGPEYGKWHTVLWVCLYAAFVVGTIIYITWKLPRGGDSGDGD